MLHTSQIDVAYIMMIDVAYIKDLQLNIPYRLMLHALEIEVAYVMKK